MTGICRTPRRPMVAEDIRDLQLWTGHCGELRRRLVRGRRLARPLGFLLGLLWLFAPLSEHVEWALDVSDHAGGDAGIPRRRIELLVSQQRLDDSDISAAIEKMGGEAMTKT